MKRPNVVLVLVDDMGYSDIGRYGAAPGFFYTDAITDEAVAFIRECDAGRPFFLYLAYTAPHWPLHAKDEDMATYRGHFDKG